MEINREKFILTWIEALRSGEYKQGTGALRTDNQYCCLGVACDIYDHEGWNPGEENVYEYDGRMLFMPDVIKRLTGLTNEQELHLMSMNDDGKTFQEIADCIEKEILANA